VTDARSPEDQTPDAEPAAANPSPDSDREDAASAEPSAREEDAARVLVRDLSRISAGFADLFRDTLALLKAESRLFASSLLLILVLAVVAGFLLAGATLLLVAAPVVLLIELGWVGPTAALVAVLVMLVLVAAALLWLIGRLGRDLVFRRSRAALRQWSVRDRDGEAP
jgi:hypothetical protein